MPFASDDLGMSDDALTQIEAQLANTSNPDPIGDAIARATQKVADYTYRYTVPQERQYRLIRALTLYDLYSNPALGVMPPNVADMNKEAMKELTDIRDGKFLDLELANPAPSDLGDSSGEFGGTKHIDFRRGGGHGGFDE